MCPNSDPLPLCELSDSCFFFFQRAFRSYHPETEDGAKEDKHSDTIDEMQVLTASFDGQFDSSIESKVAFLKSVIPMRSGHFLNVKMLDNLVGNIHADNSQLWRFSSGLRIQRGEDRLLRRL